MSGAKDLTVSMEPLTDPERIANAILQSLKAQLDEGFEFIVHVIETQGGKTHYSTGAAIEDPNDIPFHAFRALQAIADPDTIALLRQLLADG